MSDESLFKRITRAVYSAQPIEATEIRVGSLDPLRKYAPPPEDPPDEPCGWADRPIDLGPGVDALLLGLPVIVDDSLPVDRFRVVTHDGRVLHEGNV